MPDADLNETALWLLGRQTFVWLQALPERSQVPARPQFGIADDDQTRFAANERHSRELEVVAYDTAMALNQIARRFKKLQHAPNLEKDLRDGIQRFIGTFDGARLGDLRDALEHLDGYVAGDSRAEQEARILATWEQHQSEKRPLRKFDSKQSFEESRSTTGLAVAWDDTAIMSVWMFGRTYEIRPSLEAADHLLAPLEAWLPPLPWSLLAGKSWSVVSVHGRTPRADLQ